jgi:hypothetical protein
VRSANEAEIIGLNIRHYRRMSQTEDNAAMRQAIQKLLEEFEAKLSPAERSVDPAGRTDPSLRRRRRREISSGSLPKGIRRSAAWRAPVDLRAAFVKIAAGRKHVILAIRRAGAPSPAPCDNHDTSAGENNGVGRRTGASRRCPRQAFAAGFRSAAGGL